MGKKEETMFKSREKFMSNNFDDRKFSSHIGTANDLLVNKQFKECLELCLRCIANAKSTPENSR